MKEWMTLDGVFDADTMDQWWNPYDSAERQQSILEVYKRGDVYLLGRTTYEMLWPFWSTQTDDDGPGQLLNRMKKYVVSTTLSTAPWKEATIIKGTQGEKQVFHIKGGPYDWDSLPAIGHDGRGRLFGGVDGA